MLGKSTWVAGACAAAVIAILPLVPTSHSDASRYLLEISGDAGASAIAVAESKDGDPHLLTDEMWRAAAPSPSFDGERFLFTGRRAETDGDAIWEMTTAGSRLRMVTAGNGAPGSPAYLPNGRVIYSDSTGDGSTARAIYSVAPDGSETTRLTFGYHRDEAPVVLTDGKVLFNRVLQGMTLGYESLEMTMRPSGTGVSRYNPLSVLPAIGLPDGRRGGVAVKVEPRPVPPVLTSVVKPDMKTGTLLCLNIYTSEVPAIAALNPGSVKAVRVSVVTRSDSGTVGPTPIGSAPVFDDGSFQVTVPADVPLVLSLTTGDDTVVAEVQSGIWVRPNETRGCIGCHEDPDLSPVNRLPLAITRPATTLAWPANASAGSGG